MPEPVREAWVTLTRDPTGLGTLAKGACSEARGGVGSVQAWTQGPAGQDPWTVPGNTTTGTPTLSPTLPWRQEDNCLHPISHFTTFSHRVFSGDRRQGREGP